MWACGEECGRLSSLQYTRACQNCSIFLRVLDKTTNDDLSISGHFLLSDMLYYKNDATDIKPNILCHVLLTADKHLKPKCCAHYVTISSWWLFTVELLILSVPLNSTVSFFPLTSPSLFPDFIFIFFLSHSWTGFCPPKLVVAQLSATFNLESFKVSNVIRSNLTRRIHTCL